MDDWPVRDTRFGIVLFQWSCPFYFSTGYSSNVIKNESVAFDWHKFWEYLKPHLLKFLAAIAVSEVKSLISARLINSCFHFVGCSGRCLFQHKNTRTARRVRQFVDTICACGRQWAVRHHRIPQGHERPGNQLVRHVCAAIVFHVRLHPAAQPNWRTDCGEIASGSLQANNHSRFIVFRCESNRRTGESAHRWRPRL